MGCGPSSYACRILSRDKALRKFVRSTPPTFDVAVGKPSEVLLEMEEGIPVRGTLVDAKTGKPCRGRVVALMRTAPQPSDDVESEEDGRWILDVPQKGEYTLWYNTADGQSSVYRENVKVEKGKPVEDIVIKVGPKTP